METGYLNKYFSGVIVKNYLKLKLILKVVISMNLMEIKPCDRYWEQISKEESLTRHFYIWKMILL